MSKNNTHVSYAPPTTWLTIKLCCYHQIATTFDLLTFSGKRGRTISDLTRRPSNT